MKKIIISYCLFVFCFATSFNSYCINTDRFDKLDSLEHYYSNIMDFEDKSSLTFSDSLFGFAVFIKTELPYTNDSLSLYVYLIKIEKYVDGAIGEYVFDYL